MGSYSDSLEISESAVHFGQQETRKAVIKVASGQLTSIREIIVLFLGSSLVGLEVLVLDLSKSNHGG